MDGSARDPQGWFERVFAYGFAYTLDRDGWNGHLDGRVPLLTQRKGLTRAPTFFATRPGYLDLAYRLGRDFATDRDAARALLFEQA